MQKIYISGNHNQTIYYRSRIFASHPCETFTAVIDNSSDFNMEEWKDFEFPLYSEGFTSIEFTDNNSDISKMLEEASERENFIHNDKWHGNESLEEHNERIEKVLKDDKRFNHEMILLHDFGKPSVVKENLKDSQYLCYYNHGNIGTRELITYMSSEDIKDYYIHLIICSYHMAFLTEDYTKSRKPEIFEMLKKENLYDMLKDFSQADQLPPYNS